MIVGKIIIFFLIAFVTSMTIAVIGTKLFRWMNKERNEVDLDNLEYEELKERIRKGE